MTSKHTPGPWRVGSVTDVVAPNGYVVARIGDPVHMHNETTAANARLIAAAPDLLDLARNVGGLSDSWLAHADRAALLATILEYRAQARAVLDGANNEPNGDDYADRAEWRARR